MSDNAIIWTKEQTAYVRSTFAAFDEDWNRADMSYYDFYSNRELDDLANEAIGHILTIFGDGVKAIVKREDKYSDKLREQLIIQTSLDADTAMKKLEQFDNEFWIDNCHRADHLLSVHMDFI